MRGICIIDFIDLALATFSAVMDGNRRLSTNWFEPLRTSYLDQVMDCYQSCISRTFAQLIDFCRSLPDSKRKVMSEYFEFPVLTRYPFFRNNGAMICWHPAVFYRGIESLVHSVLSEEGQAYMDRFSKLFEQHVISEARKVPTRFLDENELGKCVAAGRRVPDGLLSFPDCNIFVESKAGLFDESFMTVGHSEIFARKARALTTAVSQAWSTCTSIREQRCAPSDVLASKVDYLLIVTNKDLGASRGKELASMYPSGTLEYPSSEAEQYLSLDRIYVLSIEDFERLMTAAARREVALPSFLAACVDDDDTPEKALFLFEQHLNRRQVPLRFSDLVTNAVDDASSRLEQALSG